MWVARTAVRVRKRRAPLNPIKRFENALVLLRCRSNVLKKQTFYYVFVESVEKAWVLFCFRAALLKNLWFYRAFVDRC